MYYKVNVGTGLAWPYSVTVEAFSETEAVDLVADELKGSAFVSTYEELEKMKADDETVDEYAQANGLICCGNDGVYMSVISIERVGGKFILPVTWSVSGFVTVEAPTLKAAIEKFKDISDEIPLPEGEYVDDSFELSTEDEDEIAFYNNF